MLTQLTAFGLSSLISMVVCWLVIRVYRSLGWVEQPQIRTASDSTQKKQTSKKTHHRPVPRGGGIPIFFSVLILALFFVQVDKYLIALLVSAALLTTVGVIDDVIDLHPLLRLVAGLAAGLIIVGSGIGIAYVTNPLGPGVIHLNQPQIAFELFSQPHTIWILADLFALIFIVWNMNIVNWSKGVDGQLPAFITIAFLFVGLLSDTFSSDPTEFNNAVLSFILAGSYLGLLVFNWYPQKIMPGYGAGSLAGFFLSVLAILSGAKVATTLMVLAIPTADAAFTIGRRLVQGKVPIWGDREHLHHQLLDQFGWGRQRISLFYAVVSLIMGGLALVLNTTGKIIVLIVSFGLVFSFQIGFFRSKSASDHS